MVDVQRKGQFIYNALRNPEFKIRDEGDIFKLKYRKESELLILQDLEGLKKVE